MEPLPLGFRSAETEAILAGIRAGESCVVLGCGSVGKSNLLRFLTQPEVQQSYLGPEAVHFLLVYLDTNKMLQDSGWGLWELMLHELERGLTERGADTNVCQEMNRLHEQATAPATRDMAARYLDYAIALICRRLAWRLVFLIDEFEQIARALSTRDLAILRALRDDYKYNLAYVLACRFPLHRLRDEVAGFEAFEEMVSLTEIWLGPYNHEDAEATLRRLEGRYGAPLPGRIRAQLVHLSGGHPGLLRAGFHVALARPEDLEVALYRSPKIQDECRRIWLSLPAEEQRLVLMRTAGRSTASEQEQTLEELRRKGIVREQELFSPLWASWLEQTHPAAGSRFHVDRAQRAVWIDDQRVEDLSPLEFDLLAYLADHRGQACSRDDLIAHLYPGEAESGVTDERLDAIVKRLRKRLEPRLGGRPVIAAVRGYGFRFVDGESDAE